MRVTSSHICKKRHSCLRGGGLGDGQADAENCVGAEPGLVLGAIDIDHQPVDRDLVLRIAPGQGVEQLALDRVQSLAHALAEIAIGVAVAQLDRFVLAGRGARGDRGAPADAALEFDIDFERRVAPAIEDFPAANINNGGHAGTICWTPSTTD